MTDAGRAYTLLFSQLLELHATYEESGRIYRLPDGLADMDAVRIARHAGREGYSPEVFTAALKDLELITSTLTIEEIWTLLEGRSRK